MTYKFEKLEIYQLALDHLDLIYALADRLPASEQYNLRSQIIRAATSVVLNIAEGSTSQSDAEQARFLGMALRSLVETVACRQIVIRRKFLPPDATQASDACAQTLFVKIQAMRNVLAPVSGPQSSVPGLRSP
ncbi:MAG: four helix bundle protein [Verrucomicrobia bacterium]|nr:four helix bundle protein [Verrucomicrobiota bacterium]